MFRNIRVPKKEDYGDIQWSRYDKQKCLFLSDIDPGAWLVTKPSSLEFQVDRQEMKLFSF